MMDIIQYASAINTLLILAGGIGVFFSFRYARKNTIITIQDETIKALQDQINVIKDEISKITNKNIQLEHVIETIQSALKQRGIFVTIDGDMVTIEDNKAVTRHQRSQTMLTPTRSNTTKKKTS